MYVDNLTLTAIVILVIAIGGVVRYCICGLCGGPDPREHMDSPEK